MMTEPHFYCHSSERMLELEPDTVALTVTSPPYWNAIDYDVHVNGDGSEWYRTRLYSEGFGDYGEYLDLLTRIFAEVLRVTKPGGFCAAVIGTVLHDRKHYPVPFHLTHRLTEIGWDFHQDITWHKTTAGVRRAGVAIQRPYPGYLYPNIMKEYILIFRKPGPPIYQDRTDDEKKAAQLPIDQLFKMDEANDVWHIAPVPPKVIDHPCPFPEEIPYRLIKWWSYPGDLILDPFVGSGQTTKVAVALGRDPVGYDTRQEYIDYAKARVGEPLRLRAKQLTARFDKIPLGQAANGAAKYRRDGNAGATGQDFSKRRLLERPTQPWEH